MLHFSPAKTASILIALLIGLWLAAPNLMPDSWRASMPSWLPHQTLTLGLDLQGGSYFLLEVDQNAVIKDQVANLRSQGRQTLNDNKIRSQAALQGREPEQSPHAHRTAHRAAPWFMTATACVPRPSGAGSAAA